MNPSLLSPSPSRAAALRFPRWSWLVGSLGLLALGLGLLLGRGGQVVRSQSAPVSPLALAAPTPATSGRTQRLDSAEQVPDGLQRDDWNSIRSEYQKHRHAAIAVAGGQQARNPEQQWLTRFDGRGFAVAPDAGAWSWGLELDSYGFAAAPRTISGQARVTTAGQRVAYQWDETLEEWYVNDQRGLEHGFTLQTRPAHQTGAAAGPLELRLRVRGELRAQVAADGQGVGFVKPQGGAVINYSGLKVWDADGKTLAAHFEPVGGEDNTLRLRVEESEGRYPLTIDPIAQQAYLKASNPGTEDFFGWSVAISGNTVVVGAPGEASNATGVNGNQTDNSAPSIGAAYVFVRSGATWSQQAYLKASNADPGDNFGISVAVDGDTVVVGAINEESNATGVNGDQTDNSKTQSGAAYVFVRSGMTWAQQAYLKASNTDASDYFGFAVAVSGNTVVVGAFSEGSNATGINGDQSNNSASQAGAAYVFVRSGMTWTQQAYLKASNTRSGDAFGYAVAVAGDTIVVGAQGEASNATGVNGNQNNNLADDSGAAYIFVRNGTTWTQQAYLKASNTNAGDGFGFSVAALDNTIVVGSPGESSNATGVNGDQMDNSTSNAGAVYVFVRNGTTWSQQAYLKASNPGVYDIFGNSVALSGDTIVVGARQEDSNAIGENGNQMDNSALDSGAAYVFVRSGTTWSQQAYLKASNTGAVDEFGFSVAMAGNTVVVGARLEDSNAPGVNGNQNDNSVLNAGAAYIFVVLPPFIAPNLIVQAGGRGNNLGANLADPAVCLDPGGLVGIQATVTNPNNVPLAASFTATLPAGLTALASTCVADVAGPCTIAANGGSVSWNGTLAVGQTVNIVYRARIDANAGLGSSFTINNMATVGGVVANLAYTFTLSCPLTNTRTSNQKAGSVLVFPYYTSTIGGASDTRMTISNISNAASVVANQAYVHLFFIDGTSCQQSDLFLCLTPNASFSFKASDYDPGNTGYLIAVAVNNQGVPIQNNVLIGNAFVNTTDFADNYSAGSFAANSFAVATVDGNTATLYFDHTGYDAVPKQFTTEIQSPLNAAGQQVVTASLSGNLVTSQMSGAAQIGTGLVYNGNEKPFGSFNAWLTGTCQAKGTISTTSPRVPNGMAVMIPSGQAGTLKFNVGAAIGLLLTPRTATWKGIRTLHKTQTVATTLTIPIFVPVC